MARPSRGIQPKSTHSLWTRAAGPAIRQRGIGYSSDINRLARDAPSFTWRPKITILRLPVRPAMAINGMCNRRYGPGGSTRRLHQFPPRPADPAGAVPRGRNRIDVRSKACFSLGMVPPLSGRFKSANQNEPLQAPALAHAA